MPSTPYSFEIPANEHSETLKGGALGGFSGLALGFGGVYAAATRYPAFRQLTLPLRAFLITSSGTFGGTRTSHSLFFTGHEDATPRSLLDFIEGEGRLDASGQLAT